MVSVVYLHGFRSSPQGTKSQFIKNKFESIGIDMFAPDLNYPSFEDMTITSMVNKFVEILQNCNEDTVVFGSSMGTRPLLTAIDAKREGTEKIKKIILISPSFNLFKANWAGQDFERYLLEWKEKGYREFELFSDGTIGKLKYQFVEDNQKYMIDEVQIQIPALVFHGTEDELVDISLTDAFVSKQKVPIQYERIEGGDHQLNAHLDFIWDKSREFIFNSVA